MLPALTCAFRADLNIAFMFAHASSFLQTCFSCAKNRESDDRTHLSEPMFKALVMHLASRHLLPENSSWIGKLAEEVISRKTNESTQQHTACRQWHRQLERVQQAWPPQRVVAVAPLRELRTKPSRFCSPLPACCTVRCSQQNTNYPLCVELICSLKIT